MTNVELIMEAKRARERAYCPYSHHSVGAALVGKSGKIYLGCNVENSAYGPTNCAERKAFFTAVCEGEREFSKIAIVGGMDWTDGNAPCAPCGVCRQVMSEFCVPEEFIIVLANGEGEPLEYTLKDLLPLGFVPDNVKKQ